MRFLAPRIGKTDVYPHGGINGTCFAVATCWRCGRRPGVRSLPLGHLLKSFTGSSRDLSKLPDRYTLLLPKPRKAGPPSKQTNHPAGFSFSSTCFRLIPPLCRQPAVPDAREQDKQVALPSGRFSSVRGSANLSSEGTQSRRSVEAVRARGPHVVSVGAAELCWWSVKVVTDSTRRKQRAEPCGCADTRWGEPGCTGPTLL